MCIIQRDIDRVDLLLKYDANVKQVDSIGNTVLMELAGCVNRQSSDNTSIFNLLLKNGADVLINEVNEYGERRRLRTGRV